MNSNIISPSHTKHTGESTFNIPMLFNQEICLNMAMTKRFVTDTKTFPIIINTLNTFSAYTHGGVVYTGSNIGCRGESLRLLDGLLNTNMIRQMHFLLEVSEIDLMVINTEVISPKDQIVLGPSASGHAYSDASTYVWAPPTIACNLLRVLDVELESVIPGIWFSQTNKFEIDALDSFHHKKCDLKITKTSAHEIFLFQLPQNTNQLQDIDNINIDVSVDIQIRFQYIYTQMSKVMNKNYKILNPYCNKVRGNSLSSTIRVSRDTFVRNLGDVSVEFQCKRIQVAPVSDKQSCYSMLPVMSLSGKEWFLHPSTRILMEKAIKVPCSPANVPIYKTNQGPLLSFSPERKTVISQSSLPPNSSEPHTQSGLYPTDLVREWLGFAFLQHLSIHSYSFFSQAMCQNSECQGVHANPSTMYNYLGDTLKNISVMSNPALLIGIDLEKLGGRCSIFICILLSVYVLYAIAAWIIRFALFKDDNTNCLALACRATCPNFFLIANSKTNANDIV